MSYCSFYRLTEGRRLSRPSWQASHRDGLPARRWRCWCISVEHRIQPDNLPQRLPVDTVKCFYFKSIKFMFSGLWNSMHCSVILRRVKNCSVAYMNGRVKIQPVHHEVIRPLRHVRKLLSITVRRTLPGTDSNVMVRQLLHSLGSPFLADCSICPFIWHKFAFSASVHKVHNYRLYCFLFCYE